jgi:hypothetical protein
MQDNLTVGERHIDGTLHGSKVISPLKGIKRSANEFPVPNPKPVLAFHDPEEYPKIVCSHLVAKASAPTVEHNHNLTGDVNSKQLRQIRIENVLRASHLYFKVMIA